MLSILAPRNQLRTHHTDAHSDDVGAWCGELAAETPEEISWGTTRWLYNQLEKMDVEWLHRHPTMMTAWFHDHPSSVPWKNILREMLTVKLVLQSSCRRRRRYRRLPLNELRARSKELLKEEESHCTRSPLF